MSSTFSIISPRVQSVHDIARWLMVDHDLPLAALDDDSHRGNSKHADNWVSAKKMRKYVSNMSIIVEVKLKSILPWLFILNFDGWSHAGIHYLGVMASFFDRDGEHHERLLMIAPLYGEMIDDSELVVQDSHPNNVFHNPEKGNEATVYTAKAHIKTINRCLEEYYGKTIEDNVVCVGGDSAPVCIKIARLCNKPYVQCGNHIHTLEMKAYTIKEEVMARSLENMHIVMIEARKSKSFAELRNNCDYYPELLQETRWYSMNGMAEKYNLMIPAFEKVPAISRVMPYQKNEGDTDPQD
jgi:hypothetical protein